jgi:hypothetical protein
VCEQHAGGDGGGHGAGEQRGTGHWVSGCCTLQSLGVPCVVAGLGQGGDGAGEWKGGGRAADGMGGFSWSRRACVLQQMGLQEESTQRPPQLSSHMPLPEASMAKTPLCCQPCVLSSAGLCCCWRTRHPWVVWRRCLGPSHSPCMP